MSIESIKSDSLSNKSDLFGGAFISYILIIFNALYGFILIPFIIERIGADNFGVYRTIYSFAATLMVLDIGLAGTTTRFISSYRAKSEHFKIPSFILVSIVFGLIMISVLFSISVFIYNSIDLVYVNGLTTEQIILAKRLFILLVITVAFHILENIFNGIIAGFNLFVFSNGIKLIRLMIRILLTYIFLHFFASPEVLIYIDLFLVIVILVIEILFIIISLKITFNFSNTDWSIAKKTIPYSLLIFITSIVAQVNNNLDNVVIGAFINARAVTIYSLALLLFNVFSQLSTSISGVILPTITESLERDDDQLSNTLKIVIQVGRVQFIILGAALSGFILVGIPFINIWFKDSMNYHIYFLGIILMFPALFELITNAMIAILRAKNLLGFRTITLTITTVLNLLISIYGIRYIGFYAAALGTSFSYIVGSLILMNIYYFCKLKVNVLNIYKEIFRGIFVSLFISVLVASGVFLFPFSDLITVLIGGFMFIILLILILYFYGLNHQEKSFINHYSRKYLYNFRKLFKGENHVHK